MKTVEFAAVLLAAIAGCGSSAHISTNKLIDRSQRIVMEVCGVSRDEATKLLERAGKSVKLAIVMQKKDVSREEAEKLLAENGGVIRRVTKDAPPPIRDR